ncbi:MAG: type II toxin-antitoxin system RelE/ParE family toxin [Terriglobia bacterium]
MADPDGSEKYEVSFSNQARRFLKRLRDTVVRRRIKKAIDSLAESKSQPTSLRAKHLEAELHCLYRIWVGDWRVIYELEGDRLGIVRIGHRSEVY